MIAFFILLLIVVAVIAIDIAPQFYIWQSRIHIGRWSDSQQWKNAIGKKSLQWLNKTPTIKLTDNKRLILLDMLRGNYKRNAIQHWQQAALLLGLIDTYESTQDDLLRKQINDFVETKIDAAGNWKTMPEEIDGVILAYAIAKVPWIDPVRNQPALDAIWENMQKMIGPDGTLEYRKRMIDFRYVDTIGFICPFLVRYGVLFQKPEAIALSLKQISEFNRYGMFPGTMLPCHTYDYKTKVAAGLFGWGRGLAWYAIGLIDAWNELPSGHLDKHELTCNVVAFAKTAMQFQNPNGSWNWLVTNTKAQPDSSATAVLAYFLSQTYPIDGIRNEAEASVGNAISYLKSVTKRDGSIDLAQGDTKDIGVHSQEFGILPFAQGFAVRAAVNSNK